MFAKSTITLFVLAVGLSSLLSGHSIGSASAHPLTENLAINQNVDSDNGDMDFFQFYFQRKPETNYGAQTLLHQNAIQGSNTDGENFMASALEQNHVTVKGNSSKWTKFWPINYGVIQRYPTI
nr:BV-like protein [Cotesia vestalis bracovirus]